MLQEICETVTSSKGLERGCVCVSWRAAGSRQNGKSILSKAPAVAWIRHARGHPAWRNIYLRSAGSVCCSGPRCFAAGPLLHHILFLARALTLSKS